MRGGGFYTRGAGTKLCMTIVLIVFDILGTVTDYVCNCMEAIPLFTDDDDSLSNYLINKRCRLP